MLYVADPTCVVVPQVRLCYERPCGEPLDCWRQVRDLYSAAAAHQVDTRTRGANKCCMDCPRL